MMSEEIIIKLLPQVDILVNETIQSMIALAPIFLPIILGITCWKIWLVYKEYEAVLKQNRILLEIKLPREIKKTPLAMEMVLNVLNQGGGEGTWYVRNFLGGRRTWFSLEIVSLGGQVKFFIWTEKKFKNLIESQFYAQYPAIEIYEVPDYTQFTDLDLTKQSMWANEFALTKKDGDPYPIKTYVDYGLDKAGIKDEEKTDPITPIIELFGSIGKGEQLWLQIMVRTHKKNFKKDLAWVDKIKKMQWSENYDWTEKGKTEVKNLLDKLKPEGQPMRPPTKGESAIISAVERNIDKPAFDCGIRGIYITEKDKFNPINIAGLTGAFKQFNSMQWLNGFKPIHLTAFDFPWQDYKNIRVNKLKQEMFGLYKRRAWFYYPYTNDTQFVLSSEELATIFHLPGGVAQTPTFSRIGSKKSEPPVNLPF